MYGPASFVSAAEPTAWPATRAVAASAPTAVIHFVVIVQRLLEFVQSGETADAASPGCQSRPLRAGRRGALELAATALECRAAARGTRRPPDAPVRYRAGSRRPSRPAFRAQA